MPDAGHFCMTIRAFPIPRDVIRKDDISPPPDQLMAAFGAKCVFILPDLSRQIPRIDISQPGFLSDLRRAQEDFRVRVIGVGHLVILVERGHMPGNIF